METILKLLNEKGQLVCVIRLDHPGVVTIPIHDLPAGKYKCITETYHHLPRKLKKRWTSQRGFSLTDNRTITSKMIRKKS